ncbi:MAG TPA: hypothetical protein VHZ56_00265 [Devosia sp.]|jgi:hypothetical protein|nr:hypothetical protein [Devosia sp.]
MRLVRALASAALLTLAAPAAAMAGTHPVVVQFLTMTGTMTNGGNSHVCKNATSGNIWYCQDGWACDIKLEECVKKKS